MAENSISVLFRSCASGLESACEELFLSLRPVLERIATRVAKQFHAPSEIEDVVQEMCLRISEKKSFLVEALPDGDDPAKRYLAVMAANVARDWFRGRLAKSRKFDVTISIDSRIPELALALGVYPDYNHDYLLRQIENCVPGNSREQALFRLYYIFGYTAAEIACIPAISLTTKGVESALQRVCETVRNCLSVVKSKGNVLPISS